MSKESKSKFLAVVEMEDEKKSVEKRFGSGEQVFRSLPPTNLRRKIWRGKIRACTWCPTSS